MVAGGGGGEGRERRGGNRWLIWLWRRSPYVPHRGEWHGRVSLAVRPARFLISISISPEQQCQADIVGPLTVVN